MAIMKAEIMIIKGVYHKTILFYVFSCNFDLVEEYRSVRKVKCQILRNW